MIKSVVKILFNILLFIFLTALTQTGGVVLVLWWLLKWFKPSLVKGWRSVPGYLLLYVVISFMIVPPIARLKGRVPLPVWSNTYLKPANYFYPICNRHYVRKNLKEVVVSAGEHMNNEVGKGKLIYLDACFPFMDGFPLLPHLSHNDGKKMDLVFIYKNENGIRQPQSPSYSGYGYCDVPRNDELNYSNKCKGNRWYQAPVWFAFGKRSGSYIVDENATADLIKYLNNNSQVQKIFIEPHLKQRWGLQGASKVRFQGCHSVRHDDHIHFQVF